METREAQAQQDRQQRNRLIVFGVLLTILLCVLLAPTRHLSGWWNADGPGEATDTSASDVTDADGLGGAHALSPFRTNVDRLFALDDAAAPTGLEGILIAGFATPGATPDSLTLVASTGLGGALDDGALGAAGFGDSAFGTAAFGAGAFDGYPTEGAASPGGAFFAGGSASGFGGGSGSGASAALPQSEPRQSRSGHTLRTDSGENGSASDAPGSGSTDNGNAFGSGDPANSGGSGGGSGDSVVFVAGPGDPGPADGGVNVSVYPSGPGGETILSDPSADPPAGSGPGGVSFSSTDPTPVSEPATLLLFGSGLVVFGYRLNRRSLS
jgi:hypothetical protein